jgi:ectoine hydroxylase-related dioxygenase (phytanoyl-CoA dioxygenase family)
MTASVDPADGLERVQPDTHPDKLADLLHRDGGLIIESLIEPDVVDRLNADLDPWIDTRRPGFSAGHDATFYGTNTKRVQGIPRKSRTFVDEVLLHPALLSLADLVLLPNCGDYWMSQAETIFIGPDNPAQDLHRDDLNWNLAATLRVDLQISVLVALGEYTPEVGATMVVPGSHTWPLDRPIDPADARPVTMEPGSALVYLGSLVHGGGHNRTTDRWRRALYLAYLVGWLTPEEAVSVSVGADLARTLPARARELLGWANLRQRVDTGSEAEAALQFWQLDGGDLDEMDGAFHHR